MEASLVNRFLNGEGIVLNKNTHIFKPLDFRIKKVLNRVFIFARYEILNSPQSLARNTEGSREFINQISQAYDGLPSEEWIALSDRLIHVLTEADSGAYASLIAKINQAKQDYIRLKTPPRPIEVPLEDQLRSNPRLVWTLRPEQLDPYATTILQIIKETPEVFQSAPVYIQDAMLKHLDVSFDETNHAFIESMLTQNASRFFSLSLELQKRHLETPLRMILSRSFSANRIPSEVIALLEPRLKTVILAHPHYLNLLRAEQQMVLKPALMELLARDPARVNLLRQEFIIACLDEIKPHVARLSHFEFIDPKLHWLFKEEIFEGFKTGRMGLGYISYKIQNHYKDQIFEIIKDHPFLWRDVEYHLRIELLPKYLAVVEEHPECLIYLSTREQSLSFASIKALLAKSPHAIRFVHEQEMYLEEVLKELEPDETDLSWMHIWEAKDPEYLKLIVSKNGLALSRITPYLYTDDLVLSAVKQNPASIMFAKEEISSELKGRAIKENWQVLYWLDRNDLANREDNAPLLSYIETMLPDLDVNLKTYIVQSRNLKIKHFLLLQIFKARHISPAVKYECSGLSGITPNFLKMIFANWESTSEEKANLEAIIKGFKPANLKSQEVRLAFFSLLFALESTAFPLKKKKELFFNCCRDASGALCSLEEAQKRASLLQVMIQSHFSIDALSGNYSSANMIKQITKNLTESKLLKSADEEGFVKMFLHSRHPTGVFVYADRLHEYPERHAALAHFIETVSKETFVTKRHEHNSYKDLLGASLAEWEKGFSKSLEDDSVILDSEDWQDLFFCGTEVQNSCQRLDGDGSYNQCLLGYMLDGKIRVLCVKDHKDGPIKARALMKIMLDPEGNPCIYLEKTYPQDSPFESKIASFAKQRAQAIGLPIYKDAHHTDLPTVELLSNRENAAGIEYSDGFSDILGMGGKIDGTCAITAALF